MLVCGQVFDKAYRTCSRWLWRSDCWCWLDYSGHTDDRFVGCLGADHRIQYLYLLVRLVEITFQTRNLIFEFRYEIEARVLVLFNGVHDVVGLEGVTEGGRVVLEELVGWEYAADLPLEWVPSDRIPRLPKSASADRSVSSL